MFALSIATFTFFYFFFVFLSCLNRCPAGWVGETIRLLPRLRAPSQSFLHSRSVCDCEIQQSLSVWDAAGRSASVDEGRRQRLGELFRQRPPNWRQSDSVVGQCTRRRRRQLLHTGTGNAKQLSTLGRQARLCDGPSRCGDFPAWQVSIVALVGIVVVVKAVPRLAIIWRVVAVAACASQLSHASVATGRSGVSTVPRGKTADIRRWVWLNFGNYGAYLPQSETTQSRAATGFTAAHLVSVSRARQCQFLIAHFVSNSHFVAAALLQRATASPGADRRSPSMRREASPLSQSSVASRGDGNASASPHQCHQPRTTLAVAPTPRVCPSPARHAPLSPWPANVGGTGFHTAVSRESTTYRNCHRIVLLYVSIFFYMQMLRRWILYVFRRDRQRLSLVLSRFKSVEDCRSCNGASSSGRSVRLKCRRNQMRQLMTIPTISWLSPTSVCQFFFFLRVCLLYVGHGPSPFSPSHVCVFNFSGTRGASSDASSPLW